MVKLSRKSIGLIAIVAVLVISLALSVSASIATHKTAREVRELTDSVETLTHAYVSVESRLDNLDEKLDFIKSWCMQAPSVTLGDTYINSNDKVKTKNY